MGFPPVKKSWHRLPDSDDGPPSLHHDTHRFVNGSNKPKAGPNMSLSNQDVRKLALLARLELSDDEVGSVGPQLDSIFGFVHKLSELDTDGVEPMTTALDVNNCWRTDTPTAGLSREDALKNAPSTQGEYFLVPPVLGKV